MSSPSEIRAKLRKQDGFLKGVSNKDNLLLAQIRELRNGLPLHKQDELDEEYEEDD